MPEDPVLKSARREAVVIMLLWFAAMMYTVLYCYFNGYNRGDEPITFVLGFPSWVFWGIITPWMFCLVFSWWFVYCFVKDEDLGTDPDTPLIGEDAHG